MYRLPRCRLLCPATPLKRRPRLLVEELETRSLPSSSTWPAGFNPVAASGTNVTLDRAQDLTALSIGGQLGATGTIGTGPGGAADAAFYRISLAGPAHLHVETFDQPVGPHLNATLSVYDTDPQDPLGYHLIAQTDGAANQGYAVVDQTVAAGTYYVAVTGSGNDFFNPFLVGSGYPGATGAYAVQIAATDVRIQPTDGPAVLSASADGVDGALIAGVPLPVNPALPGDAGALNPASVPQLTASPYLLRVELSAPIDPNTLAPDSNVVLYTSPTGDFSDPSNFSQVFGVQVNFDNVNGGLNELQVTPSGPLAPGYYQLAVLGNTNDANANPGLQTVLDANDVNPLGFNGNNPTGQDYTFTFQVTGSEGVPGTTASADDTAATARQLGSIAGAGRVQVTGVLGDDPTDPNGAFDPATVDLYHFTVSGSGNYSFAAEVFAQRIGSTLDPALSLFRANPATGHLDFVASNLDTGNTTVDGAGNKWLQNDAALFVGLTAGDYYVAVSSGRDAPNPAAGVLPGDGTFDPNVSHSGVGGNSTGPYVLNLEVQPSPYPPHVVATSIAAGATLDAPPATLTVQFDRPVNLQQSAFGGSLQSGGDTVASVFILDAAGNMEWPCFESYDPTTNQANFIFLNPLPNGTYTLHLSGADGLTDLAGNALVGNDPNNPAGDYVVPFTVNAPTATHPTAYINDGESHGPNDPQVLGNFFPAELPGGVSITRTSAQPGDTADYYQFTVSAAEIYTFRITQRGQQQPTLSLSVGGKPVGLLASGNSAYSAPLQPGTYVLGVVGADGGNLAAYTVTISAPQFHENATPLTSGPAPALSLRLVSDAPPPAPPPPPIVPPVEVPPAPPLPIVLAPTPPAVVPIPPAPAGTEAPAAPIQAASTVAATVAPAGPVSASETTIVSATGPAPGIPPQLALALSEGPLGGVRVQPITTGSVADSGAPSISAAPLLAALTTPLIASSFINNSADGIQDELLPWPALDDPTAAAMVRLGSPDLPATAPTGLSVPDATWLFAPSPAIARGVTNGGVEVFQNFDRWLASLPVPSTAVSRSADAMPLPAPTIEQPDKYWTEPVVEAPAPAEIAGDQVAPSSWTDALLYRPLWCGAGAMLTVLWGGLHGQKWLAARRERQQKSVGSRQ